MSLFGVWQGDKRFKVWVNFQFLTGILFEWPLSVIFSSKRKHLGLSKARFFVFMCIYLSSSNASMAIKAIGGGPGTKKPVKLILYIILSSKKLIAVISSLFTECQNSTPFRRYDQFNFRGSWLLYWRCRGNFW